jgi:predicted RNA binding protein with dsRBD fold (UPF0201 family)
MANIKVKNQDKKAMEIIYPDGIEIDLDEAWRKLISNQFTGSAGRGFGELVQNFLDSYSSSTPWNERQGKIKSGKGWISIIDFGEGMDRDRLALLVTLGGTDKNKNISKIGTFGIGFFSIFNPKLKTRKVRVITQCEGQVVEIFFVVKEPGKRPQISTRILKKKISFSTEVKVEFDDPSSVGLCLDHAESCLKYYPCRVTINGRPYVSIWQQAEKKGSRMFKEGHCDGFVEPGGGLRNHVTLLCKYEHLMFLPLNSLMTGGHSTTYDLRDFKRNSMPFLDDISTTINCNNLNVTISRDSFSMNFAYSSMIRTLANVMETELGYQLEHNSTPELILPNQYVLINKLRDYLNNPENNDSLDKKEELTVISRLARAKVYRINGRRESYSLADLLELKSEPLPLFYSPRQDNLRWLGGNFKHDFIVLPPYCDKGGGAPDFYDLIFKSIFGDVVNLDTIRQQNDRLKELVEAGVVEKEALSPKVQFEGERDLEEKELKLLEELDTFFTHKGIREAITKNLHLRVKHIRTVFFDVKDQKAVIATGLFDNEGKALSDTVHCNLDLEDEDGQPLKKNDNHQTIMLGLHRNHELIRSIIANKDPYRLYFSLPILAHELALCQKLLVPYSLCYHLVKEQLASDMRKALMDHLLPEGYSCMTKGEFQWLTQKQKIRNE